PSSVAFGTLPFRLSEPDGCQPLGPLPKRESWRQLGPGHFPRPMKYTLPIRDPRRIAELEDDRGWCRPDMILLIRPVPRVQNVGRGLHHRFPDQAVDLSVMEGQQLGRVSDVIILADLRVSPSYSVS